MKFDEDTLPPNLLFWGSKNQTKKIKQLQKELRFNLFTPENIEEAEILQFVFIDLRDYLTKDSSLKNYLSLKKEILEFIYTLKNKLALGRFISVQVSNIYLENKFYPIAWDLAKSISSFYSLKDEKIGWIENETNNKTTDYFKTNSGNFYSLYFRNDEKNKWQILNSNSSLLKNNEQIRTSKIDFETFPSCYILKPKPRNQNEILHPAKYPEDLAKMYINAFTQEGDNVFDPMSGTGSTQISAFSLNRNSYGTELSKFFYEISKNRCIDYYIENPNSFEITILRQDACKIKPKDFPKIDYIITSPPYWDMLNIKGAENQAKRIKKGLQLNYSESDEDIGNIENYNDFLDVLTNTYFNLLNVLKPGGYITIVVKNIKKKGINYPLAWDISERLQEKLILLPETFWFQNDISIAPFGYYNTYVSNTFHQYCLNFQKPF
jgi:DNA modification methylase